MMQDDRSALAIAYHAARLSPDPRTQMGAYLVSEHGNTMRASIGCNNPLRGATVDWESDDDKANLVHHAEEVAILSAATHGIPTWGSTLYCPWSACLRCARSISGSRVRRVVGHRELMRFSAQVNPKWNATIAKSLELMTNAGIICEWVDGPISASPIRHAGFLWNPQTCKVEDGLG